MAAQLCMQKLSESIKNIGYNKSTQEYSQIYHGPKGMWFKNDMELFLFAHFIDMINIVKLLLFLYFSWFRIYLVIPVLQDYKEEVTIDLRVFEINGSCMQSPITFHMTETI